MSTSSYGLIVERARAQSRAEQETRAAARRAQASEWAREKAAPVAVERVPPKPRKRPPRAAKEPDTVEAVARDLRRLGERLDALLEKEDDTRRVLDALAQIDAAVRRGELLGGVANDIRKALTGKQP